MYWVLCLYSLNLFAGFEEKTVKKFLQDKYFHSRSIPLILKADGSIPFVNSKLFRVQDVSTHRGWTVWANDIGRVIEIKKGNVKSFFSSLAPGLVHISFSLRNSSEAKRIGNGLLNHLGTSQRVIDCQSEIDSSTCELFFTEGPYKSQKISLKFDFKKGFILEKR